MTLSSLYRTLPLALMLCLVLPVSCDKNKTKSAAEDTDSTALVPLTFCADSAMKHIVTQCDFGPRVPNSEAHDRCAAFIVSAFRACGLSVSEQDVTLQGWDGANLRSKNITASYAPERKERIVIATHWESRPWADNDADASKHHTPVMAANDGASGVAVMLELARLLPELKPAVGVDFVCFDAEDYGAPEWGKDAGDGSDWCLGSQYWAAHLPEGYHPRYGILLDMVGGADTQFRFEYYSRQLAPEVLARVWSCAVSEEARELFLREDGTPVMDDHIPMNQLGHIPTIDIIGTTPNGFCATWHTTQDVPQAISPRHLTAVGQTLLQLLFEEGTPKG